MDVRLHACTDVPDALAYIGHIAGVCYKAENDTVEKARKRALNCAKNGHASIFEHISFTFYIEGISRACSHQLVRHRLASYTQCSQRYTKIDSGGDWYTMPEAFESKREWVEGFDNLMGFIASVYDGMVNDGIKPEDARAILPNACRTDIFATMNLRELCRFVNLRTGNGAQAEIHALADGMWDAVCRRFPELEGFAIAE